MSQTAQKLVSSRCVLCPAGCEVSLASAGPDAWRSEYAPGQDGGLCPRGSALGELICHPRRIVEPAQRVAGRRQRIDLSTALRGILDAAGDGITFLLDGNLPCEQLAQAAGWCGAWPAAEICFVIELAERQLLGGLEAARAKYLRDDELAGCDGFVIIGDAFAANPICAKGLLDRRKGHSRTPIVVIDSAAGTAVKFATHRVETDPGMEFQAIAGVALAAGLSESKVVDAKSAAEADPSAKAAGKAIAGCKRLGVLIAGEYGRSAAWEQIGCISARLAASLGGAVAPQTTGANTLAAVRLASQLGAISLAEAMSSDRLGVAIGCDVLGMLGRQQPQVFAAAAPLPNCTTDQAQIVLPVAMTCELGGTYLQAGQHKIEVSPLLPAPAGVPAPAEIIAALAEAAGIAKPDFPDPDPLLPTAAAVPAAAAAASPSRLTLLFGRRAALAGCGALTAHGSWQEAIQPLPEMRISPGDARAMNLKDLAPADVEAGGKALRLRVRVAPELSEGRIVLPAGIREARALNPCAIDDQLGTVTAVPVTASVSQ